MLTNKVKLWFRIKIGRIRSQYSRKMDLNSKLKKTRSGIIRMKNKKKTSNILTLFITYITRYET